MNHFRNICLLTLGLTLISVLSFSDRQIATAQTKPLTYPEIITALNTKLPNRSFKTKTELLNWLIAQINRRKIDKPLTEDREDDLRQAGATDQLLETIRRNSPASPMPTPTPTPTAAKPPANTEKNFKNSLGIEFVRIPSGTFTMGSPTEEYSLSGEKQHRVTISRDFYMGKYEVTQGQWKAVMRNNPSVFSNCGDNCPVENVSWEDIQTFIKKLNAKNEGTYRLPTEAEWEYAARAGTTATFGIGDGITLSSDEANLDPSGSRKFSLGGEYLRKTVRVGSYKPNAWGLYDMHGNVSEWCADWYDRDYYEKSPNVDPTGPTSGSFRVVRGGSWMHQAEFVRSASRAWASPDFLGSTDFRGFRLVRE